ncbi:hypothetical protein A2U01_0089743, partial [Trifolium medium]|nr:hypothetical protein [Trifolium medium]
NKNSGIQDVARRDLASPGDKTQINCRLARSGDRMQKQR